MTQNPELGVGCVFTLRDNEIDEWNAEPPLRTPLCVAEVLAWGC